MNRGERTYRLIKESGDKGCTTADLSRLTGLMDIGKAIQEARREWCSRREMITDQWDRKTFFGFFPRKQKRYFLATRRK